MKRYIGALLMLTVLIATSPLRAADEPYDFYAILPVTGPAAFLGHEEVPTLSAIEKYVNAHGGIRGRPLHFIVQDDQSSAAVSVQLANQIIAKRVPAFLGPGFGATCSAVEPLLLTSGPVMYCTSSATHPPPGSYAFVFGLESKDFTANVFRYFKAKGARKIALLVSTDATGQDGERGALDALKYPDLRDLQLVADEHFGTADLSVAAQMTRIKAAGPDAIDAWVTGPAFGTALRGIYESGYDGYVMTSAANANKDQLQQYVGFLPDKLVFSTLGYQMTGGVPARVQAAKKTFLDAMHQIGIETPSIGNMLPWDPMLIMIDGLRKYGPEITAQQMRDFILNVHDWPGTMGMYDFRSGDQRGIDPKSTGAQRWDKSTGALSILSKPGGGPL